MNQFILRKSQAELDEIFEIKKTKAIHLIPYFLLQIGPFDVAFELNIQINL